MTGFLASSVFFCLTSFMYVSDQAGLTIDISYKNAVTTQVLKSDSLFELKKEQERSGEDDLDRASEVMKQQKDHHAPTSDKNKGCTIKACTQQERFKTLHKGCAKYSKITNIYNPDDPMTYSRLKVDDHNKILYCDLPKAASTTFNHMIYYSITGKYLDPKPCAPCWEKEGMIMLYNFNKEERDQKLRDYYKILVVRHPLDRFVSCWNDKLAVPWNLSNPEWQRTGPPMIKMFRKVPQGSTLEKEISKGVTLQEFAWYVNHLEQNSPDEHDPHWNTHYRLCHPCSIDYNLIVKVETMQIDTKEVLKRLHLNGTEFPLIHARRTKEKKTLNLQKTIVDLRNISSESLQQIKQFYKLDMELFDYKWTDGSFNARCGGSCQEGDRSCC